MLFLDRLAEERIQEAIERGNLDDLPGIGTPLAISDEPFVPEELRLPYHILKNAGYLPKELELRREISELRELIAAIEDETMRRIENKRLNLLLNRLGQSRDNANLLLEQAYYSKLQKKFAK